jgi:hypothetical protein
MKNNLTLGFDLGLASPASSVEVNSKRPICIAAAETLAAARKPLRLIPEERHPLQL